MASTGIWLELTLLRMLAKLAYDGDPASARPGTSGLPGPELTRAARQATSAQMRYHRLLLARVPFIVARSLIHPQVYQSVGLDPALAHRAALANPHYQETLRFGGEKIVAFLDDAGLIGGPGGLWRKSCLIAA